MPSKRTLLALYDVRANTNFVRGFVADMDSAAFAADRRTFYAATRCLAIISEAARRLSPAMRDRHPDLAWRAIMGSGNIYRHDYDNVVETFVWRTIHESLGPLLAMIEQELAQL